MQNKKPKVIIIGAGFGGLWAARTLANQPVDVTVIDRNNYHTFLALLYQVAAAELNAEDIAYPVRSIFWKIPNVKFLLAHARRIDLKGKRIETDHAILDYDYLILCTGSVTSTFGVPGVEENAYFLKTLEEAVALKNHIICCFEAASRETDVARRKSMLTFVIVGGGATGVEYAGALAELIHGPLRKDYPSVDFSEVRIVLLEAADYLVAPMPENLRAYAAGQLRNMGVDVRLKTAVADISPEHVILKPSRERSRPFPTTQDDIINTNTVVWTAGVRGEELAEVSGIPVGRDGRVPVYPTLQVTNNPDVYVAGDLASIKEEARVLPMVAQVAIQSGVQASRNILLQISGRAPEPFRYHDRGSMIAIGRKAAGVAIGKKTFQGFIAWMMWLVIHLFNLIGFRNRVMVLTNWAWDYLLYERAVRYVFPSGMPAGSKCCACAPPASDDTSAENKNELLGKH